MVRDRKYTVRIKTQPVSEFSQSRAFIVGGMAESGINIVTHDGQVRDAAAILVEIFVNDIRIAIIPRDQAKRRVGVLVNPSMEARVDPGDYPGKIVLYLSKQFRMSLRAFCIPFLMA